MTKDMFGYDRAPSSCCGAAIIESSIGDRHWPVCSECGDAIKTHGRPSVYGELAADRLMRSVQNETRRLDNQAPPTPYQVAMVLHALADHTAILAALKHRPDSTSPWLEATSVGRWFHDVGDDLEEL